MGIPSEWDIRPEPASVGSAVSTVETHRRDNCPWEMARWAGRLAGKAVVQTWTRRSCLGIGRGTEPRERAADWTWHGRGKGQLEALLCPQKLKTRREEQSNRVMQREGDEIYSPSGLLKFHVCAHEAHSLAVLPVPSQSLRRALFPYL
jgi:hypothetical protein